MTTTDELQTINGRLRGDINQLKKEIELLKELNKERIKNDIDALILQKDQKIIELNNKLRQAKKDKLNFDVFSKSHVEEMLHALYSEMTNDSNYDGTFFDDYCSKIIDKYRMLNMAYEIDPK